MMRELLIATANRGKQREYLDLLAGVPLRLCLPEALGLTPDVKEDGDTYEQNALNKAQAFASLSGMLTLADDTGLEVDVLGGEPGVRSARYAGPGASDEHRRKYLLERLRPFPQPWSARFRCVIALVEPGQEPVFAHGICNGEIVPIPRGTSGFGYDPIFQIQNGHLTLAELGLKEKNQISHRAQALRALLPALSSALFRSATSSA
jgi:XTP/dITP diphosphohydrolase